MNMLDVAIYDTLAAVWQAKHIYNRPRPGTMDPDLPAIASPASPSFPDEYAATAGAASAILSNLYPEMAQQFASRAEQAGESRLRAGVAFPSDVQAGLRLGRAVAERVIAYPSPPKSTLACAMSAGAALRKEWRANWEPPATFPEICLVQLRHAERDGESPAKCRRVWPLLIDSWREKLDKSVTIW